MGATFGFTIEAFQVTTIAIARLRRTAGTLTTIWEEQTLPAVVRGTKTDRPTLP